MSNAILDITIYRTNSPPVTYQTADYFDINAARADFQKIVQGTSSLVIGDEDDAGFQLIPVRNITGVKVREADPEEERRKAEERQRAELRAVGHSRKLPGN